MQWWMHCVLTPGSMCSLSACQSVLGFGVSIFFSATFVNSLIVDRWCGVFCLDNRVYLWRGTLLFLPLPSLHLTSSCLAEWLGPAGLCWAPVVRVGTLPAWPQRAGLRFSVWDAAPAVVFHIFITTPKKLLSVPGLLRVSITSECWVLSDGSVCQLIWSHDFHFLL